MHDEVVRVAKAIESNQGLASPEDLKSEHGIFGWCPLCILPLFNIVWDILPDMMHIMEGIYKRILFQLFKGKKLPAPYKPLKLSNKPGLIAKAANTAIQRKNTVRAKLSKKHRKVLLLNLLTRATCSHDTC